MNLPAHSSLKCERNIRTSPLVSPHKSTTDTDLPARSITHLKSSLRTSLLVTNPAYPWPSHQTHPFKSICNGPLPLHYYLALPKRHQAKLYYTLPNGLNMSSGATSSKIQNLWLLYRRVNKEKDRLRNSATLKYVKYFNYLEYISKQYIYW